MLIVLLQILFIALKLDGIVDWPWFLVFSPVMAALLAFRVYGPGISYEVYHVERQDEEEE